MNSPIVGIPGALSLFSYLRLEEQEVVAAAFLDSANRCLSLQEIFRGTVEFCIAQPREILRQALKHNAVKFLLAHNHVSGLAIPSEEDLRFTVRLEWACDVMGVPLVDHLIMAGDGHYFSFAEARLLGKTTALSWKKQYRRLRENQNPLP